MQFSRLVLPAIAVILVGCANDAAAPPETDVTPQAIQYTGTFWGTAVAAGGQHTCAIADNGALVCWGSSSDGQASVSGFLGAVRQVAAGAAHTCAIKNDWTVSCWGAAANQQLSIPSGLGTVKQISANGNHTCVIRTDNTVVCWGDASSGQTNVPGGLGTVRQVSAGATHTCAIKADNTVICWGGDDMGQASPSFGLGTVQQIAAAETFTCAIKSDGTVACWGASAPSFSGSALHIAAGLGHACIIQPDGLATCAGDSSSGQTSVPFGLGIVTQLTGGAEHTCALKAAGGVACWGGGLYGQSNVPVLTRRFPPTAVFTAATTINSGYPFSLQLSGARVILPNDTLSVQSAGIHYSFDCGAGDGYALPVSDTTRACTAGAPGLQIVRGLVRDQEGDFTEYVDTVVVANGIPVAPTGMTTGVVGRTVTLNWSDNAFNEDTQILQRRAYIGGAYTKYITVSNLLPNVETFTDTSAAAGTTYQYRVRACSEAGCSYTTSKRVTTQSLPLPSDSIKVRVETGSSIRIDWFDSNTNESRFELLRRNLTTGSAYAAIAQPPANTLTYLDATAVPGQEYAYRVRPCNAAGCAESIVSARVMIAATVPNAPINAGAPAETIEFGYPSWTDASLNETYFKLFRRQKVNGVWTTYAEIAQPSANSTGYVDVSSGYGTFQYRVVACNTFGCSLPAITSSTTVVRDPWSIPP